MMKALLWCSVLTGFWSLSSAASETPTIKDRWTQCKIESNLLELTSAQTHEAVERDSLGSDEEMELIRNNPKLFNLSKNFFYPKGWTYEVVQLGAELDYKSTSSDTYYSAFRTRVDAYLLIARSKTLLGVEQAKVRFCVPQRTITFRNGKESGISFTFDRCKDFRHGMDPGLAGWGSWYSLDIKGKTVDGEIIFQADPIRLQGVLWGNEATLVCEAVSEIH